MNLQSIKSVALIAFVFTCSINAQVEFRFNYLITYTYTNALTNTSTTQHYLTNANDNSYTALLTEKNNNTYTIKLVQHDGYHTKYSIKKDDFNTKTLNAVPCQGLTINTNSLNQENQNFGFSKMPDIIIEDSMYPLYSIKCHLKNAPQEDEKIGYYAYAIENDTPFHKPMLTIPSIWETWQEAPDLPNGIFKQITFTNYKGETEEIYTLKTYKKIDKTLYIKKTCANSLNAGL